jgi:hypothetical protein
VPDTVTRDGVSWSPDWSEQAWDRFFTAKAQDDAQWLADALKRVAAVAMEIDRTARELALQAEQDRVDAWFAQEAEENAKLRAVFQKLLDKPEYDKLVERTRKAGLAIRRDTARIEKAALLKRGLVRGRRG